MSSHENRIFGIWGGSVRSHFHYDKLFRHSTISAQIVDDDYNLCYISEAASLLGTEMMRWAEKEPLNINGMQLHSAAISGGHVLWQEDVSQLLDLRCELNEVRARLQENNELLKAEVELKERRAKVKEQNRLYDKISGDIDNPLKKVGELVADCEKNPAHIRENLQKICVIGAYAKRRGNLILLGDKEELIGAKELEYCIRESLDQIRLSQTAASMDSHCGGQIAVDDAMAVYDIFEEIIEAFFSAFVAVMIHLTCGDGKLHLRVQLGLTEERRLPSFSLADRFDINACYQDEDLTIDLYLPKGDGRS